MEIPPAFAEKLPRFAALGEIGFDRRRGGPLPDQLALFDRLLRLGADCCKPVVLHVVGSFESLFEAVKPYPLRFMIHGFRRKSPQLLGELVKRGFYVSLHRELVRDAGIMNEVGRLRGRAIGLESDDADCDLAALWEAAASASGVPDLARRGVETFREFLNPD